jgi:hypothetical protein
MTLKSINNESVSEAIEEAAKAACERLDIAFPGLEKSGITSNFQGALVECLRKMVAGIDPTGSNTQLPTLVFLRTHFGDPSQHLGHTEGFAFMRKHDESVLSMYNKLTRVTRDDFIAYTSFEYAYTNGVEYLENNSDAGSATDYAIVPVYLTDRGYAFQAQAEESDV